MIIHSDGARGASDEVLPDWGFMGLIMMQLPSVLEFLEKIWNWYEGFIEHGAFILREESAWPKQRGKQYFWLCIICCGITRAKHSISSLKSFNFLSLLPWEVEALPPLISSCTFSLYSLGSSLTLLVDLGCDGLGEATESHIWHQLCYLRSSPLHPWLCLFPNLSKGHSEVIKIWQGLGGKGVKRDFCFLISPPSSS